MVRILSFDDRLSQFVNSNMHETRNWAIEERDGNGKLTGNYVEVDVVAAPWFLVSSSYGSEIRIELILSLHSLPETEEPSTVSQSQQVNPLEPLRLSNLHSPHGKARRF